MWLVEEHLLQCFVAVLFIAVIYTLLRVRNQNHLNVAKHAEERRRNYPVDTVILHQIGRGPNAPSLSPFPLKFETYLRMAKIPYQNEFYVDLSAAERLVWMTYNGEQIHDSQPCIDFLNEIHEKDLNSNLTLEKRAIARAFQKMTEEHLYWCLSATILGNDCTILRRLFPGGSAATLWSTLNLLDRTTKWTRGAKIYRQSLSETINMGLADLKALSTYMGSSPFFMGEEPCEIDCAIFAVLAQIKWQLPGSSFEVMLREDFANLGDYCERMKEHFWPDWDDCNTAGGTREAPM